MRDLAADLRHVLRSLRRTPGFALFALTVLALGIGLNAAVFSAVQALLVRALPFANPHQLVIVQEVHSQKGPSGSNYDNYLDWSAACTTCEGTALIGTTRWILGGDATAPEEVSGAHVTSSLFPLLNVRPQLGRLFLTEEETRDRGDVVILGHAFWQRRFGGAPDVIGRSIRLDSRDVRIVGVLPESFRFNYGDVLDLWMPFVRNTRGRHAHQYGTIARLRPGVTLAQTQAELDVIARRLEGQYPESNTHWGFLATPMGRSADLADPSTEKALLLALAASGAVLLIACANLAGLLLARSVLRAREMAIRLAVGASRWRLVRLVLTESVSLSLAGGVAGVLVAPSCLKALAAMVPAYLAREVETSVDASVLTYAFLSTVATGLLAGIPPALRVSRAAEGARLRQRAERSQGGRTRGRLLGTLVVAETALALVLLVAASLLTRSLVSMTATPLGFRPDQVLTLQARLPGTRYEDAARAASYYDALVAHLEQLPGVIAAGVGTSPPLSGGYAPTTVVPEGHAEPVDRHLSLALGHAVTPGYFRALGISVLRGREFTEADGAASERVVIINEALARRDWPGRDPLGRRLREGGRTSTIVGIAGDVRHRGHGHRVNPEIYVPGVGSRSASVIVRVDGDPMAFVAPVRTVARALDRDVLVFRPQELEDASFTATSEARAVTHWAGALAALALLLAATGLFGIAARAAAARRHELGIRVALGAGRTEVVWLLVGRTLGLVLLGTALGIGVSYAVARSMRALLHGVVPGDPLAFGCAGFVLATAALLAAYVPARRASRVDPIEALRCE